MDTFLLINLLAFIAVTLYAVYLFARVIATRIAYIKLGQKSTFDGEIKERIGRVVKIVFGQSKLLKDKKSGIIHVMMFYGFLLVQFGAIDMLSRVSHLGITCRLALFIRHLSFSRNLLL